MGHGSNTREQAEDARESEQDGILVVKVPLLQPDGAKQLRENVTGLSGHIVCIADDNVCKGDKGLTFVLEESKA